MNNHAMAAAPPPIHFSKEIYRPSEVKLHLKNGFRGIPFIERIGGVFAADCRLYAHFLGMEEAIRDRYEKIWERHTACFIGLVEGHFTEPYRAGFYSSALFMSDDNLRKACKKATGRSPQHWVITRRLIEGLFQLRGTGRQVQDIAFDCGVENPAYFCRLFREVTGMTTGAFREL